MTVSRAPFTAPTAFEMLEAFSVDPATADPDEGLYAFELKDATGLCLRISWDIFQRSIQASLRLGDRELVTVCQEGATRLWIEAERGVPPRLLADFQQDGANGRLVVDVLPSLKIWWAILST